MTETNCAICKKPFIKTRKKHYWCRTCATQYQQLYDIYGRIIRWPDKVKQTFYNPDK